MPRGKRRILVVDDEARYIWTLRTNLGARGYYVLTAMDGRTAIELAASEDPDLVLLDLKMPDLHGFEVCRRIRQFSAVPIIMLTAMADEKDMIQGLDAGADDYVTKPFSVNGLMARVRSALRRTELAPGPPSPALFEAGSLRVDLAQQRVYLQDQEVLLTPTEYHLLRELVQNEGRILVSDLLLERVWGPGCEGDHHLVRQAIHRLRQKIEPDPQHPQYIQTRTGIGYVFVVPE
jgi:two-component system KDP operon response regulator KdpE